MRKKLLLLAVALLGMASAQAQTLSVDGNAFEALKGKDATLTVKVGGDQVADVRDVQFNIVIPDNIELGTPAPADATNFKVAISDPATVTGGKQYTVILYSDNATKGATDINFPLTIPSDFSGSIWGKDADKNDAPLVSNTNAGKWTNESAVEADATSTAYTFQVGILGDANKDGGVDVGDINTLVDLIGTKDVSHSALAANANGDNDIDVGDINAVIDIIRQ